MHSLDPSEQLAAILNSGYAVLLSVLSLAPRFCIIAFQYVLKNLAANVPTNIIVREVGLMLALQCGASMIQHTPGCSKHHAIHQGFCARKSSSYA